MGWEETGGDRMTPVADDFLVRWDSLSEIERKFLLTTHEVDERLSHSYGLSKVIPPISWRTVGLMCRVELDEVDDLVRKLAELRLVCIISPELREMGLICGGHLRHMTRMRRKRLWNWATLAAVVVGAAAEFAWLQFTHHR